MKTKTLVSLLLAIVCGGVLIVHVRAQALAKKSSAPETSKILFENDRTRVIEYRTNGGRNVCGLGIHSHPPHVFIMLTDAELKVVTPDGKETTEKCKAGEAGWEPAVTHRAENITGKDVGVYLIEFKDKDWRPSTGLSP